MTDMLDSNVDASHPELAAVGSVLDSRCYCLPF